MDYEERSVFDGFSRWRPVARWAFRLALAVTAAFACDSAMRRGLDELGLVFFVGALVSGIGLGLDVWEVFWGIAKRRRLRLGTPHWRQAARWAAAIAWWTIPLGLAWLYFVCPSATHELLEGAVEPLRSLLFLLLLAAVPVGLFVVGITWMSHGQLREELKQRFRGMS